MCLPVHPSFSSAMCLPITICWSSESFSSSRANLTSILKASVCVYVCLCLSVCACCVRVCVRAACVYVCVLRACMCACCVRVCVCAACVYVCLCLSVCACCVRVCVFCTDGFLLVGIVSNEGEAIILSLPDLSVRLRTQGVRWDDFR